MTRTRINLLKYVQTYILIALDKKHAVYIVLLISETLKLLLNLLMADSDTDVFSEVLRWKSSRLNRHATATDQSSNYPVLLSILQTNLDLKVAITNN